MQKKILYALHKYKDGYISGEELASKLKVSRTSVWNNIEFFRKQGYEVEAHPRLGYKLISVPDRLFPDEIQRTLKTKIVGKKIWMYEETESTNSVAIQFASNGKPDGSIVASESQTKGRGRMGRKWFSPRRKGIWFSVILRPQMHPESVPMITVCGAVAVGEAISSATGLSTWIKWPNDIYINDKKVGGILLEASTEMDRIAYIVMGIGINVNVSLKEIPQELKDKATSISIELGEGFSRVKLFKEILENIDRYYSLLKQGERDSIVNKWKDMSLVFGKRVKVVQGNKEFVGRATGVDTRGDLIVRLDNGFTEYVNSGDVILEKKPR